MKLNEDNKYRLLLFFGVLAPIVLGIIIIVVGHLTPEYSQVTDTVSKAGITGRPYAWLLHSGYYTYGILMGMAAYGLNRTLSSVPGASTLVKLLGIHALGTVLLAVFPDSNNSPFEHMVHNIISITSYLPLMIGIFISRSLARHEMTLKVVGILGIFIIIVNLPMPVINMVHSLSTVGGLLQRILSACSYIWLALTFLLLYRKRCSIEHRREITEVLYPSVRVGSTLSGRSQG